MNPEEQYETLIESLKLLAATYETQVSVLPDFVDLVFEVVDTYENAFFLLPTIIRNDFLSKENIASLISLYFRVFSVYSNDDLCTLVEFRNNERWNEVRQYAIDILKSLNISNSSPNLDHITWVKGNG